MSDLSESQTDYHLVLGYLKDSNAVAHSVDTDIG